jgi:transcriptional regulator with XRE-family HTH domain
MDSVTWEDFGAFLRHVRRRQGVSQDRLAAGLGCHRTYIWRLESGHRRPSRFFLRLLMRTYPLTTGEQRLLMEFEHLRTEPVGNLEPGQGQFYAPALSVPDNQ